MSPVSETCADFRHDVGVHKTAGKFWTWGARKVGPDFVLESLPYCDEPVTVSRSTTKHTHRVAGYTMQAPCRKCAKCLLYKSLHWRDRAQVELLKHSRSWHVVLTFAEGHKLALLGQQTLEPGAKEKRLEKAAYRHVQKYFKRLRKKGHKFRYLAVFERGGKSEREHFHVLLHETGDPISKRVIQRTWSSPIVYAKLVNHGQLHIEDALSAASYVSKYATKDAFTRFRASSQYGA